MVAFRKFSTFVWSSFFLFCLFLFVSGFSALDSRFSTLAAFHFPISTGFFAFPFVALLRGGVNGSGIEGGGGYCLWLGSPSCQIDCKKGPLLGSFTFVIGGLFAAGSASLSFPFHSHLVRQPRRSAFASAAGFRFQNSDSSGSESRRHLNI